MAEKDCRCLFVAFCLGVGGEEGERKEGTGIEETVMQWQTAKRNNYANWWPEAGFAGVVYDTAAENDVAGARRTSLGMVL